ncbi:MAG: metallophosphoesterase [Candidatus Verstraetearchaeota archaeon]|nr:metallophosphoesterase [Candidatus Verstraetearchaeota archaeon]
MVKFLALSDIHGKLSSLRPIVEKVLGAQKIDAITVSGDVSHYGDRDEVKRILDALGAPGLPVFFVLGNCDPREASDLSTEMAIQLENRCERCGGLLLTGAGGSTPTPFGTTFEREEEEIVSRIRENLGSCNSEPSSLYLLVHNPPYGTSLDRTSFGRHVGSRRLRELIEAISPAVVQCGHIHEAAGVERIGDTVVFNPGPAMKGNYALVEVDAGGVAVSIERA